MAKIKITPPRSLSDDSKSFFAGKKCSMDEEQAATYIRGGWVAEWSTESDGTMQTDGGNGDGSDITDDLINGQGGGKDSDGTGAGGV